MIMFMMMLFMSIMFSFTFLNMLGVYMMMELNLISYLPLLIFYNNNYKSEIVFIYFIIQSMSSMIFLVSLIFMLFLMDINNNNEFLLINLMYMLSLLIKLGCVPFHFWYLIMMKYMSWINCYLLSTVQKIMPMIFLNQFLNGYMYLFILMCSLLSFFSLNEVSLRLIMAYSSINHMSWMLMSIMMNFMIWLIYFMIYSMVLLFLMNLFNLYNMYYINQINVFMNYKGLFYMFMLYMFSLGGMPPFLGFYMKWFVLELSLNNMVYMIYLLMILGSMVMLFNYIRLVYMIFMFHNDMYIKNMYFFYMNMLSNKDFLNLIMFYIGMLFLLLSILYLM